MTLKKLALAFAAVSLATFAAVAAEPVKVKTVAELRTAVNSATTAGTSWDDPLVIEVADGEYDFEEVGLTTETQQFLVPKKPWMKIVSASRDPKKCVFIGTAGSAEHDTSTRAITVGSSGNAWIEGITFTNFTRGSIAVNGGAGAIYVNGCTVGQTVVTNCVIDFCTASQGGGKTVACNASSEFLITDCRFLNCPNGSVVASFNKSPLTVRNCTFVNCASLFGHSKSEMASLTVSGCTAYDCTGAITTLGSFTDCVFSNVLNATTSRFIDGFCSFARCTFVRCKDGATPPYASESFAGALNATAGKSSFVNCSVVDCETGKIFFRYSYLTNCLVSASGCNKTWGESHFFDTCDVVNCTVVECGSKKSFNVSTTFLNDIFVGCDGLYSATAGHVIYDTLAPGQTLPGDNKQMTTADIMKMFVGEGPDPYQLCSGRAYAVDQGAEVSWWPGATDRRGGTRVIGSAVDIGCYEYRPKGLTLIIR